LKCPVIETVGTAHQREWIEEFMTQQELKEWYQRANLDELSSLYFRHEGPARRRKHFEDVWFGIGFQARNAIFTLDRTFRLLGLPDLALGNPSGGKVGWFMHSVDSAGEADVIVGFDVKSGVITKFWSASVKPDCSPAHSMILFENSEMKEKNSHEGAKW
jgi:hypothetical protein